MDLKCKESSELCSHFYLGHLSDFSSRAFTAFCRQSKNNSSHPPFTDGATQGESKMRRARAAAAKQAASIPSTVNPVRMQAHRHPVGTGSKEEPSFLWGSKARSPSGSGGEEKGLQLPVPDKGCLQPPGASGAPHTHTHRQPHPPNPPPNKQLPCRDTDPAGRRAQPPAGRRLAGAVSPRPRHSPASASPAPSCPQPRSQALPPAGGPGTESHPPPHRRGRRDTRRGRRDTRALRTLRALPVGADSQPLVLAATSTGTVANAGTVADATVATAGTRRGAAEGCRDAQHPAGSHPASASPGGPTNRSPAVPSYHTSSRLQQGAPTYPCPRAPGTSRASLHLLGTGAAGAWLAQPALQAPTAAQGTRATPTASMQPHCLQHTLPASAQPQPCPSHPKTRQPLEKLMAGPTGFPPGLRKQASTPDSKSHTPPGNTHYDNRA